MAEESILLRVGIDENQIARSEAAIIAAREEIEKLKAAQKALAAEGKANTVEYVRNETALRENTAAIRDNQRVLDANQKLLKGSGGSIKELRANVSRLKEEYINLSEEQRNNTEVGGALQKELLRQTEELKKLEAEIGVTSRNVGNYTGSILEAVDGTGLFTKAQQAFAAAQKVATAATQGGTIATQSFGKALMATGIGAIVILLGSLISYLTRTQEGMDKVAQATEAVGTFVAVVFDEFSRLGKQVIDSIIPTFKGLGEILAGIFTLDYDRVTKGFTEVKDAVSSIDGINVLEVGKNAAKAAADAAELTKQLQNVVRQEKALDLQRAQSRQQITELKKIAEDTTKSQSERLAATQKAEKIEGDLLARSISLQKERIRILKAQNDLSSSTDADINRVIEAEIELANLQQESGEKQIELQNKRNELAKTAADNAKAISDKATSDREKADAEALKAAADLQAKLNEQFQKGLETRQKETDLAIRDSINSVKQQFADGLINLEEYQKQLDQVEALALETRKAALTSQLEATRTNAEIDAETRLGIEQDLQSQLRALEDERITAGVAARQAEIEAAKKSAEEKKKLATETAAYQIQAENAVLSAVKSVFGEQSAAGKIAAAFQALLDTYRSANLALATIPPPFGQIIAAANVAAGLANVAKIKGSNAPKFAEGGGIGIAGPSHASGGVDVAVGGQTVANVEGGEGLFVMKKTAFSALKALSDFNQKHGGRSWFSSGRTFLADGGAVARASAPGLDRRALNESQRSFESAISQLTIVTKVSDLERVQGEAKLVQVQADLR
jgi:hypothetical protein